MHTQRYTRMHLLSPLDFRIYFEYTGLAVETPATNEGMFQAFALVWQTAQNGRLHHMGGTYYQSCKHPTNSA